MPTPHEMAIRDALQVNDQFLAAVISYIGTIEHPRGAIVTAYRNARRALSGNVDNPITVREILNGLRASIEETLRLAIGASADIGLSSGRRNLEIYDLPVAVGRNMQLEQAALKASLASLNSQLVAIQALIDAGQVDEAVVLGDGGRIGLLAPGAVQRTVSRWMMSVLTGSFFHVTKQSAPENIFLKQAIAAIDQHTTECCLLVTGQTQQLDQPFVLTGTPRYADRMQQTPFHDFCRTAMALVRQEEANDEFTQEILDASAAERQARTERGLEEIWPASATSRRGAR